MEIILKNFGKLKYTSFRPNKFTVVTGNNNSGKTYATYAYYGFLQYWTNFFQFDMSVQDLEILKKKGVLSIDLEESEKNAQSYIDRATKEYTAHLEYAFMPNTKTLKDASFSLLIEENDLSCIDISYSNSLKTVADQTELVTISKKAGEKYLVLTMFADNDGTIIPDESIIKLVSSAMKEVVFSKVCKNCFISSAERTGVSLFSSHLNASFTKVYTLVEARNPLIASPLPIRDNVNFSLDLESVVKKESYFTKQYPELEKKLTDLLGGEYKNDKNSGVYFVDSKKKQVKFSMGECSSSVRSLLDITLYIKHLANKGDILMIDEPELNLHPENQRKLARLLSYLSNLGLEFFITTHSDYILRELSNLILLNSSKPHIVDLRNQESYDENETLLAKNITVLIAEKSKIKIPEKKNASMCDTLVEVRVTDENGIQRSCFDEIIEVQSRILDTVVWGEEDEG